MVNWTDPLTLALCARAFEIVTSICFGIYLWEYLVSFRFDWEHFTGKRPFRWTFVAYFLARYLILLGLIFGVRISNVLEPVNCVVWNHLVYASAHSCFAFASLLLLLRVLAIAEWNMWITAFLGAFYLANVGTLIRGVVEAESIYVPELFLCGATNTVASRVNVFTSFAFDLTCLITMLLVLMRNRGSGFWKFLVQQGIVYFMVATASYLIPSIFLILNLNDAMNEIPQVASVTTMSICATRMYRHLSSFDGINDANRFTATGTNFGIASSTKRTASQPSQRLKPSPAGVSVDIHVQSELDDDHFAMTKMQSSAGDSSRDDLGHV